MAEKTSTALTVYDRVADPMVACEKMAKPVAALCGCSPEQGQAIMLACLCDGITPFDFSRKYHMIQGRPTMKAGAMLAEFHRQGGKHEILQRSAEGASVKLTIDGEEYVSTLTWEDAQKEDFVMSKPDRDGNRDIKDNYRYPRKRMQMLWARVISDGVEALRPSIRNGLYTPEEVGDIIDAEFRPVSEPPKPSAASVVSGLASQSAAPVDASVASAGSQAVGDDVIDAEFTPSDSAGASTEELLGEGYCTSAQSQKIHDLFEELGIPHEKQVQTLEKRGAQAVRNLTKDQAKEIIDRLEYLKANGSASLAAAKN
jgi:hypothetical protein